jgi:spermidine synthase
LSWPTASSAGLKSPYNEPVIYARSTPYQRIVLTRRGDDMRLYLNGNLQFSTRDEYRYHEALVWPVLGRVADPRSVLILGGGDGLAAREVLSDARVRHVTLVDLDPEMTRLFRDTPQLVALNRASLSSPRITVVNADAFRWVRQARDRYDAVIVDFPDPTEFSLGKLYTESFYREVARLLAPAGVMTVQSTSPLGRAAILLDGGQHAGGRGPLRARISCLRSQLRRVGIYAGRAPSAGGCGDAAGADALSDAGQRTRDVRFSARYGATADPGEPARQPGACA